MFISVVDAVHGLAESKEEKYIGVDGAISKLQEELKTAEPKEFAEPIIGYLVDRCRDSESLAADICQIHKTWKKCYEFIVEKARKKLSGKSGPVRSDVVFEWAEDYYRKDDKAEEKKKAKEAEKKAKSDTEQKKKVVEKKEKTTEKKVVEKSKPMKEAPIPAVKQEKKKEQPKSKKNNKDMDGQMDFFSMMGM